MVGLENLRPCLSVVGLRERGTHFATVAAVAAQLGSRALTLLGTVDRSGDLSAHCGALKVTMEVATLEQWHGKK